MPLLFYCIHSSHASNSQLFLTSNVPSGPYLQALQRQPMQPPLLSLALSPVSVNGMYLAFTNRLAGDGILKMQFAWKDSGAINYVN